MPQRQIPIVLKRTFIVAVHALMAIQIRFNSYACVMRAFTLCIVILSPSAHTLVVSRGLEHNCIFSLFQVFYPRISFNLWASMTTC